MQKYIDLLIFASDFEKSSLVIHELPNGGRRLYFSTDKTMSGRDVMEYYCTRIFYKASINTKKLFCSVYKQADEQVV